MDNPWASEIYLFTRPILGAFHSIDNLQTKSQRQVIGFPWKNGIPHGTVFKDGKAIASTEELSKYLRASGAPLLDTSTLAIIARDTLFKKNGATYDDVLMTLRKALEVGASGTTTARVVRQLSGKTIPDLSEHRAKDTRELADATWMSCWKLGSMVRISGLFHPSISHV